jgi:hypothetical protein
MPTNLLRQTNSKSIIQNPKNTPISWTKKNINRFNTKPITI